MGYSRIEKIHSTANTAHSQSCFAIGFADESCFPLCIRDCNGASVMSMIGKFLQISADDLESLIQQPEAVHSYLFPEDGEFPDCLDVDRAWHGLDYLLGGESWDGEGAGAAAKAVLGGTEIGDDLGYGPVRYLTVAQVKEVADAISQIGREELARRFDAQAMAKAGIYAFDLQDTDLEHFALYYEELKRYYEDAAKNGNAMLLFLA